MLITSGIIALSKKISDEKAKKKEARQGVLDVGDSDVAKRAFQSQTSKLLAASNSPTPGVSRAATTIKYEDPNEVSASSPSEPPETPIYTPKPEVQDVRHKSQVDVSSPVQSERGLLSPAPLSPYESTPTTLMGYDDRNSRSNTALPPPPYSSPSASTVGPSSPSVFSRDTDTKSTSTFGAKSFSSRSTNSQGTHSIRVKTVGSDLKSGFPYHPSLFDLDVRPDQWSSFTTQVVQSTKFGVGDHAKMWGAATATALTGAFATSVLVGRSMNRTLQEKKVKSGINDTSDGGLGDTLKQWNDEYFGKLGLFVHLELSESAMKHNGRSPIYRKPASFYSDKDKERKKDERKFVIVVTRLDEDGEPMEAMRELNNKDDPPVEVNRSDDQTLDAVAELPAETPMVAELPSDRTLAELPADLASPEKKSDPPTEIYEMAATAPGPLSGFYEMSADNTATLEKLHFEKQPEHSATLSEKEVIPKSQV